MSIKRSSYQENRTARASSSKKKSKKKSFWPKLFWGSMIALVLLFFLVAGTAIGVVTGIIREMEPVDASNIYTFLDESSFIYDREGNLIEKVQTEGHREILDFDQIPEHLINAIIAIEDERFWDHNGIDVKRIFGAFWTNLRTGSRQGASTINQQLAKIIYLSPEQTYTRKIKDAYYGVQLDRQLSKKQILEAYVNTINLGSVAFSGSYSVQANGVQAASQLYFSKDVSELTNAEAALIAGIPRNPRRYSPVSIIRKDQVREDHIVYYDDDDEYSTVFNPETLPRMRLVLNNMHRLGYITDSEYEEALNQDIAASIKPNRLSGSEVSSFFGELVQRDVLRALENAGYSNQEATHMLQSGGLSIHSTLDMRMQQIMEEEFNKVENFPGTLRDSDGNFLLDEQGNVQPQSSMVIMDQESGQIKALIGGRMTSGHRIYNRALSTRQPGSAIKPLAAFTPAVDLGMTAATVIDDVPSYLNPQAPNTSWPRNHYNSFYGLMTMRESLRISSNVGAVRFAEKLGEYDSRPQYAVMFDYMERMGITSLVGSDNPVIRNGRTSTDENYSMVLGGMTRGVSPMEMTGAFATLANKGVYTKPITFTEVYDRRGNLILENQPERDRVVSDPVAFVMTDLLRDAVTSGTGSRARIDQGNSRIPVAGKTGTTNDQKDAWFVGYTPYYTASVWIGHDLPEKLQQGSRMAAELWQKIMFRVHEGHEPKGFETPDNIIRVSVCSKSGKLPTEYCTLDPRGSTVRSEIFIRGTEPTSYCEVHVQADIHAPTGKLATEDTPSHEIETRIFTQRETPYYPEEHNGIVPRDWEYELPRDTYDPYEDSPEGIDYDPGYEYDPDNSFNDNDHSSDDGAVDDDRPSTVSSRTLRTQPLNIEGTAELALYRVDGEQRTLLERKSHNIEQHGETAEFRVTGAGTQKFEIEVNGSVAYSATVEF
ncbi:transglycosylase domain-containing protein [Tindallia californiensis]|uniref:Penicillin-binding protein 1A n=1 Tax=Tindallia californiensis TaxID=159292 RepID=A0A1H3N9M3_9FIRM|nr:transglycosylase domain-containing protein [Tindallia californiensis]SDY85637.1 penicillin-binding protein 1A [Tindallia californiensis]